MRRNISNVIHQTFSPVYNGLRQIRRCDEPQVRLTCLRISEGYPRLMFPSFQVFHRMRFEAFFQFRLITRWQSVKLLL